MNALIIRELKERKTLIIVGLGVSLLPLLTELCTRSASNYYVRELAHPFTMILMLLLTFLLPIVLAESTVAGEIEGKTMSFLLSLPVSRKKIWRAKVISLYLIFYGILSFFLLVNTPVLKLHTMLSKDPEGFQYLMLFIIMVPSFLLSLSILASTLTSRVVTSGVTSLLLILLAAIGLFFLITSLEWSVSPLEILLLSVVVILIPLALSHILFVKAPFYDAARKIPLFTRFTGAGLGLLLVAVAAVYLCSSYLIDAHVTGLDYVLAAPEGEELLASVECRGVSNFRMWLLDPSKHTVKKLRERRIMAPIFTGKDTVQYERIKTSDSLLRGRITMQHWVLNTKTLQRRLLGTSPIDWKAMGSFFAKGMSKVLNRESFFFIIPLREHSQDGEDELRVDISFFGGEGGLVKTLRLPQILNPGTSLSESTEMGENKGRKMDIQHVMTKENNTLSILLPYQRKDRENETVLALDEINLDTGKLKVIHEHTLQLHMRAVDIAIAPDGKRWAAIIKDNTGKHYLYLMDPAHQSEPWRALFEISTGSLSKLRWLHDGKEIIMLANIPDQPSFLYLIDSTSGKSEIIYSAPSIKGVYPSPDGKRIALAADFAQERSFPLSIVILTTEDNKAEIIPGAVIEKSRLPKFALSWVSNDRFIYRIWPWDLFEVMWKDSRPQLSKLYPYKEEKR